jgi:hypothetical protein
VVPDLTLAESISSPGPPSIDQSRRLMFRYLTTRPSAWRSSTYEMSLVEWAVKSRQESANDPVIVAEHLPSRGTASAAGAAMHDTSIATRTRFNITPLLPARCRSVPAIQKL